MQKFTLALLPVLRTRRIFEAKFGETATESDSRELLKTSNRAGRGHKRQNQYHDGHQMLVLVRVVR